MSSILLSLIGVLLELTCNRLVAAAAVRDAGALPKEAVAGALDARDTLPDTVDAVESNILREAAGRYDSWSCDSDGSQYSNKKCRILHLDGDDLLLEFVREL
jgi:hypothetical protein